MTLLDNYFLKCHASTTTFQSIYVTARPMILAIMTSPVNRSVRFQWPLKDDTGKVFHPIIAQRI